MSRGGQREGAGRPFKPDKKKPFCFKLSEIEEKAVRKLLNDLRGKKEKE